MEPPTKLSRRLLHGGIWATVGKVLFVLGTFTWNALLTRLLSEAEVGAFYLIASVVIFVELVVLGGLNQAIMRLIASHGNSTAGIRPFVRGTTLILIVFALTIGLLYIWIIGPLLGQYIFRSRLISELSAYTAAWFALRATQTYLASILRGFHRVGIAAFVDGAIAALFINLILGYIWIDSEQLDIREVLTIIIGALACSVVVALVIIRKSYRHTAPESGIFIYEPLRLGIPLSIIAIAGFSVTEAHIWIAGIFVSHAEVAIYGAAMRLMKVVQMPLLIINSVIPSTIAQLFAKKDNVKIQKVLQSAAAIATLPSLIFALIVLFASSEILGLVFGGNYSAGGTILLILVFGQTICVAVGSPGVLMAMSGRQTASMIIATTSGLIGIGTSLLLVEAQGILGVAIGTTAGKVLYNVVLWVYCLKKLRIKTHASPFSLAIVIHALKRY